MHVCVSLPTTGHWQPVTALPHIRASPHLVPPNALLQHAHVRLHLRHTCVQRHMQRGSGAVGGPSTRDARMQGTTKLLCEGSITRASAMWGAPGPPPCSLAHAMHVSRGHQQGGSGGSRVAMAAGRGSGAARQRGNGVKGAAGTAGQPGSRVSGQTGRRGAAGQPGRGGSGAAVSHPTLPPPLQFPARAHLFARRCARGVDAGLDAGEHSLHALCTASIGSWAAAWHGRAPALLCGVRWVVAGGVSMLRRPAGGTQGSGPTGGPRGSGLRTVLLISF
jgi:hypothetical protein